MLYIIADDLTGATDTGVQFSTKSYKTDVIIYNESIKKIDLHNINSDILVLDSETREVDQDNAQKRIIKLLNSIDLKNNDIIYKKVDSTLRGNIGIELDEIIDNFNYELCIFSPSFIDNKRITKNGDLIVENKPLGETEYYEGNLTKNKASYIPNILKEQSKNNVYVLDIETLKEYNFNLTLIIEKLNLPDKTILIIDSTEETHLKEIIEKSVKVNKKLFYAGSAGLANYLSLIYSKKSSKKDITFKKSKKLLIIAASRRKIIDKQLDIVKNDFKVVDYKINIENILKNFDQNINNDLDNLKNIINTNNKIIIRPDPYFKNKKIINKLIENYSISFRKLQILIKNYISRLVKMILQLNSNFDLFITGGDTAAGVCNELEINNLTIMDELLSGIPLSYTNTHNYGRLNIITKAGGFGQDDSISKVINKLIKNRSC